MTSYWRRVENHQRELAFAVVSVAELGPVDAHVVFGWSSPQMLRRYGASARSARARRSYDRVMDDAPLPEPAR